MPHLYIIITFTAAHCFLLFFSLSFFVSFVFFFWGLLLSWVGGSTFSLFVTSGFNWAISRGDTKLTKWWVDRLTHSDEAVDCETSRDRFPETDWRCSESSILGSHTQETDAGTNSLYTLTRFFWTIRFIFCSQLIAFIRTCF